MSRYRIIETISRIKKSEFYDEESIIRFQNKKKTVLIFLNPLNIAVKLYSLG